MVKIAILRDSGDILTKTSLASRSLRLISKARCDLQQEILLNCVLALSYFG